MLFLYKYYFEKWFIKLNEYLHESIKLITSQLTPMGFARKVIGIKIDQQLILSVQNNSRASHCGNANTSFVIRILSF